MWVVQWVVVCCLVVGVVPTADILKDVTLGFGEALQHCRKESQLTEEQMEEFFHIWRDDFEFKDRELGCAIWCMSKYFDLLTDSHRMHHDNMDQFIKKFPNGELLSKKMIGIIHTCEKKFDSDEDNCIRILHIAECFKMSIKAEGIAPNIEMIMAEFIMAAEG